MSDEPRVPGRDGAPPATPRPLIEQLRRPVTVGGYIAFYAGMGLVFLGLFFGSTGNAWFVAALALIAAIVALAVGLNYRGVLAAVGTRRAAAGASVAVSVTAAFAILAAVTYMGYRHRVTWDITEDRRYSLSEQSLGWLKRLDEAGAELRIVTFLPYQTDPRSGIPPDFKGRIVELLELYDDASGAIRVTHTEPTVEFARTVEVARSIGVDQQSIPNETVVLKYGDKRRDVPITAIYRVAPAGPYSRMRAAEFRGEDAFTSAIRDLLDETPRKVYFVVGHGERTTGFEPSDCGAMVESLRGMNCAVVELDLAHANGVPADADCVVIAGPNRPFAAGEAGLDELASIAQYLDRGGRALILLDTLLASEKNEPSGLEKLLEQYGVVVHQDALALGPEVEQFGGSPIVTALPDAAHETTRALKGMRAAFFQAACLEVTSAQRPGYEARTLLGGTPGSWGERRPDRSATYDEKEDVAGPVVLAAAVGPSTAPEAVVPVNPAKIVVFADADFVSNLMANDRLFKLSRDLFLNAVNWMVERTENIGIVSRERELRTATVTPERRTRLFWGAFVAPLVVMVALGIFVWRARSR